jgi:predicted dehydrogenase
MKKIKFGIVGFGRIGKRHLGHIKNFGEIVAVCDNNAEQFEGEDLENIKIYNSIDELVSQEKNKIDVLSICSPNGLHAVHSIKSLNNGFHVLCEKPMALNRYDSGRMIQAAEQNNKRLFIVKQNRFNPPVAALKKIIDEGRLGEIYSVQLNCFWNRNDDYYNNSWKGTLELDGGTLFTQFSHFVDLFVWMFGDIKDCSGFSANKHHKESIEFEDCGVISLIFRNGIIGSINYNVNSYNQNMEGSITIFGKNGTVKIGGQYLNELEYQNIEGFEIKDLPAGNAPNNYGNYVGSMSNHADVYKNIIEVLNSKGTISTSGYEGLKTVEAIEMIYEKIR